MKKGSWMQKFRSVVPHREIILSPEDLQEFTLRRATLNNAKFQALMVEESYILWSKNLREKYALPVKFDINPQTGVVTERGD